MKARHALWVVVVAPSLAFAACTDDDSNPSPAFDASVPGIDAAKPDAPSADSGADANVASDAVAEDVVDSGFDAGDTGVDAPGDAPDDAADADAGPQFDDAGCPLPTGVTADLTDAGFTTTGLALWLRADLGVATTDGGAVCRWDDVSGNNRAFVPGTATPPSLAATALKNKPAVTFSGPGQHMVRGDVLGIAGTAGRTVAVFAQSNDTTHRYQFFHQGVTSPGTYFGLDANTFQTVGSREGVYVTNNAYDSNIATSTAAHAHILSISSFAAGGTLPGVLVYEIDGTVTTLTRTPGGLGNGKVEDFSTANVTFFGAGVSGYTGGKIGELLVWDHALTAPERLAVEQYFQARFP